MDDDIDDDNNNDDENDLYIEVNAMPMQTLCNQLMYSSCIAHQNFKILAQSNQALIELIN